MKCILETDDHGDLKIPAEFLCEVAPHTRFVIERCGTKLEVEQAEDSKMTEQLRLDWARWLKDADLLASMLSKSSTTDKSALDILSEMRR